MDIGDLIMSAYHGSLPPGYLPADNPAFDAGAFQADALDADVAEFLDNGGRELLALLAVSRLIGGPASEFADEALKEAIGCLCSDEVYDAALQLEPAAGEAIGTLTALLKGRGQ
jgi:hypothetical protein